MIAYKDNNGKIHQVDFPEIVEYFAKNDGDYTNFFAFKEVTDELGDSNFILNATRVFEESIRKSVHTAFQDGVTTICIAGFAVLTYFMVPDAGIFPPLALALSAIVFGMNTFRTYTHNRRIALLQWDAHMAYIDNTFNVSTTETLLSVKDDDLDGKVFCDDVARLKTGILNQMVESTNEDTNRRGITSPEK